MEARKFTHPWKGENAPRNTPTDCARRERTVPFHANPLLKQVAGRGPARKRP